VAALDVESGVVAPLKTFMVDNPIPTVLKIVSPGNSNTLYNGVAFDISWTDAIGPDGIGSKGFIEKVYKIEISTNGGSSWIWIKDHPGSAYADQVNKFSIQYTVSTTANIIVRVTDVYNLLNTDQTQPIAVNTCNTGGFLASLEWDPTVTNIYRQPIGLAADGTARIFIKLSKNPSNTKQVNTIQATINTIGNPFTGTALLGKIMYASNHVTYSEEANNANTTSIIYPASQNGNGTAGTYWFWLVAPDDYTSDLNEESSSRKISTTFTITYTDNSMDIIQTCSPIYIYRPPLLFVHGLASDEESFKKSKYLTGNSNVKYFPLSEEWIRIKRVNLKAYSSFMTNANILLEKDEKEDLSYQNSIKSVLHDMHVSGIASKRVDYVCHSMGGSIGRTIINEDSIWYSPGVGRYLNYNKGYINKFITICTPHNGSFLADFLIDMALRAGKSLGNIIIKKYPVLYFFWDPNDEEQLYEKLPEAGKNLQSYSGGHVFEQTNIINHLISADVDPSNSLSEETILNEFATSLIGNKLIKILKFLNPNNSIHDSINTLYNNAEFFSESDCIVQLSSQLAGKNPSQAVNITTNPTGIGNTSIIYGLNKDHIGIQEDLTVGTRVKKLLNAQMSSGYFDTTILANTLPQHPQFTNQDSPASRHRSISDTLINHVDTQFVKITRPLINATCLVDSSLSIVVHLKNISGFQNLRVFFQSDFYFSELNNPYQAFQTFIQPEFMGRNKIIALAQYDSLGYTVNHMDTLSVVVRTPSSPEDFNVTPKSVSLNPDQKLEPEFHVIYPTFIGLLNPSIDSLYHIIVDTNVVTYVPSLHQYISKDTGTTRIVFTYKGLHDTMSVYISTPLDKNVSAICPLGNTSFYAGINDNTKTYQWQLDTLNGFANIADNQYFSGTHSPTLLLTGIPSHWYNAKFKCIISDPVGISESEVFILRFKSTWLGTTSSAWENSLNWSCQSIPDAYTDVIVKSVAPHYPEVNSNAVCRALHLSHGSTVLVKPGYLLDVRGD
jgi:triacylglycerol esterase/lipase EstA (alpha/beta hydrolase family)